MFFFSCVLIGLQFGLVYGTVSLNQFTCHVLISQKITAMTNLDILDSKACIKERRHFFSNKYTLYLVHHLSSTKLFFWCEILCKV